MSGESQSEGIWQYAMRPTPADGNVRNAPLSVANEQSGVGDGGTVVSADLSDELGSFPRRFNFHGFAETQTQSQGVWLVNEDPADGTESQKENMHLPVASGSQSPPLSAAVPTSISRSANTKSTMSMAAANSNKSIQSSHVTQHVMGASARAPATPPPAGPINALNPNPLSSVSLSKDEERPAPRPTPLKQKNKTVSFLSPTAQPSPPAISRIKTMPPRLNRYAPRDINPSSQDSFAGPLPPRDLTSFARNSVILNNTFIRTTRDGGLGDVFQRHTHISSTSASDPTLPDDMASISQSDQHDEEPTPSQIMQAAFDPSLSPPRPQPVVLAKDSQSDHSSQDSENLDVSRSQEDSSSSSYHLPSVDAEHNIATQLSTQPTQPNTQLTQPNTQSEPLSVPNPQTLESNTAGPSPLPVPLHRRRQIAALQEARRRDRDEVVPETPQSTSAPSAQASVVPTGLRGRNLEHPFVETRYDGIPKNPPPGPAGTRHSEKGKEKEIMPEPNATRPSSKGKGKAKQPDIRVEPSSPARVTRSAANKGKPLDAPEPPRVKPASTRSRRPHESEVIPDSQEEEREQEREREREREQEQRLPSPPVVHAPTRRSGPRESEVIPDSQESQTGADVPASSPAVPLRDLCLHRDAGMAPPTPTPAAVKSTLRKGQLPEGVTHTRGGGRASSLKGKGKAMEVDSEDESDEGQDAPAMDVDEEEQRTEVDEPAAPATRDKRPASRRTIKKEKTAPPKAQRKYGKKSRAKTAAAASTPAAGPSTRSRKRKREARTDSPNDFEGPLANSEPKEKRRRMSKALTPGPASTLMSTRVFARRADKSDRYFPGTVTAMAESASALATTAFRVQFDDGHEEDVDLQYIRQFELQLHDIVNVTQRVKNKTRTMEVEVLVVERWEESELADVHDLGSGPDGDDFEVEGRFINVSEAQIREQWSERRVSVRTFRGDRAFEEFEVPESNERLAGFGFVITLPDLPRSKRSLARLIKASAGVVFEDWTAVVTLDGTVEMAGKRMSGNANALRVRKGVPKQLFCLTDGPSTTPKYLVALALGVPCISLEWVLGRALQDENQVDWPAYVLPAGYNPVTLLPASQAFDRAWWRESGDIMKLISHPPTFKPFSGKSFLCIGTQQFLFSEKQLGIIPRVLLAMGASYVEAVTDIDRAKRRAAGFDYTVVDDSEPLVAHQESASVDVSWIKKCLVTGVEGPVPWPDRDGLA